MSLEPLRLHPVVKLTKIYTRTGDTGETHLAGGQRVAKSSLRIGAIGDIDEVNSWIGMIAAQLPDMPRYKDFAKQCYAIQQQLFNSGAALAILPDDRRDTSPSIEPHHIEQLEHHIDLMNEDLPALSSFILPGGNQLAATIHIARAVCRRCERNLFCLTQTTEQDTVDAFVLQYINRLSDWLFVAARYCCYLDDVAETLWSY